MFNKQSVTEQVLQQLDLKDRPTLDQAMLTWWANLRTNGGMRLTEAGFDVFCNLEFEHWNYDLTPWTPLRGQLLLALDQRLTCPYYITPKREPKLVLFGSREAMTLMLFGDINGFINMLLRE